MRCLGWFTGVILAGILLSVVNVVFTASKNNGKKYAQQYMDSSIVVRLHIPQGSVGWELGSVTTGFFLNTRVSIRIDKTFFYEKRYRKYFCIYVIEPNRKYGFAQSDFVDADVRYRETITARINKHDFESPDYGTKENPVPIFHFDYRIDEHPVYKYKDNKIDYPFSTPAYYRQAVENYLTYVMSKEEFKQRFEK